MSVGRVTCPLLWAVAVGAARPYGVSLTTGVIAPASLRYDRRTPVAQVAGPHCLAGDHILGCVPASLSSVTSMAPGNVCHGPRCSLAGLGPAALEYRSLHWPGGSAGSPQCVRSWGCRPLRRVPLLPWLHVRVQCPRPRGACSPVCALCAVCVCCWWLCPSSSSPPNFLFFFALYLFCFVLSVFLKNGKGGACTLQAQAWATGAAVQQCKEGPYQDRPPLCPFRLLPLLIYSGSTIAFLKILKVQGPKSKNIENVILLQP